MDEEERLLRESIMGQNPMMEEQPILNTDDALMGGLGLGATGFAAQTGRAPTLTPQGPLSPFAQQVAANDAARLAAQNRLSLIGTGTSTSGVTNSRLVPGTSIVPTGQAPATTGSTSITAPKGSPTASSFDYTVNKQPRSLGTSSAISNITSNILKGIIGTPSLVLNPNEFADSTLSGQNIRAFQAGLDLPFPDAPGSELLTKTNNVPFDPIMDDAERIVDQIPSRTVADVIAEKNTRGPDATFTESELREMDAIRNIAQMDTKRRESNIANSKSTLAQGINELGTVTDDQRAAQEFLNERAERSGTTATDIITPFQDQAQLTADLFTDPNTASGQFVPRATFRLPDGTIVQEDEGGNRRQISAEQLRQFEQDMASTGQDSIVGLGRGGDAGVIKSFNRPMGVEETQARLQEVAGAPTIREIQEQSVDQPGAVSEEVQQVQQVQQAPQAGTQRGTQSASGRTQGGSTQSKVGQELSQADARDLVQGLDKNATEGEKMRALQIQQRYGLGDFKPRETELQRDLTQRRIDLLDKQLANAGIVPIEDPILDPETGVFMQEYSDGIKRIKGNARSPSISSTDVNSLLSDIVPTDQADAPLTNQADAPPTKEAIKYLKDNPDTAALFNLTYGMGQAEKILAKQ